MLRKSLHDIGMNHPVQKRHGSFFVSRKVNPFSGVVLLFTALIAVCCPMAWADEPEGKAVVSWGAETDYCARYVWHGIVYNEDPAVQPSAWISASGLTIAAWGSYATGGPDELRHRFSDTSFALSYSREFGVVTVEPSFEYFYYPGQEDSPSTGMLTVALSLPLGAIQVCTAQSFDLMEYPGAYFGSLGAVFEQALGGRVTATASATINAASARFNDAYIGSSNAACNGVEGSLALTCPLSRSFFLKPHAEFSRITDAALREQLETPDVTTVGLSVGMEFTP